MSVTFTLSSSPVHKIQYVCQCVTATAALEAQVTNLLISECPGASEDCPSCGGSGVCAYEEDIYSVNAHNGHASEILGLLGLYSHEEQGMFGSLDAKSFEVLVRRGMMRVGMHTRARLQLEGLMRMAQARGSEQDMITWG